VRAARPLDAVTSAAAVAAVAALAIIVWFAARGPSGPAAAELPPIEAYAARGAVTAGPDGLIITQPAVDVAVVNRSPTARTVAVSVTLTDVCSSGQLRAALGTMNLAVGRGDTSTITSPGVTLEPFTRATIPLTIDGAACAVGAAGAPGLGRVDAVTATESP
jgi:hypothetical protein